MTVRALCCDWFSEPWELYQALAVPPAVLLESARTVSSTGRYSILAHRPFLDLRYEQGRLSLSRPGLTTKSFVTRNPFTALQSAVRSYTFSPSPGLPPFSAGAIGYLSYECKDSFLPRAGSRLRNDTRVPDMNFLFFDHSVVWDHRERCIFFCGEKPEDLEKECRQAVSRAAARHLPFFSEEGSGMDIRSSMQKDEYEEAVRRVQREISAGEIFQANLSHRFEFALPQGAREAYSRLREVNPSSFFGLFEGGDFEIVSGSPERLLRLLGRALDTRPIAGTRKRGKNWKQDEALGAELLLSEKERAEHVMLVDLERNDLGRVCEYGSVHVDEFMAVEDYSHVKHIVSNVRGLLREDLDALDALAAFFPGGTITGAPKIRCAQIIDQIETVPRGPYTGSLGYLSFTGEMDFNILIRSLVVKDGVATLHAGAGIVADSDPAKEYYETLHKAEAVLEAVFGAEKVRHFFRERGLAARVS